MFVKALTAQPAPDNPDGWLRTVARTTVADYFRRLRATEPLADETPSPPEPETRLHEALAGCLRPLASCRRGSCKPRCPPDTPHNPVSNARPMPMRRLLPLLIAVLLSACAAPVVAPPPVAVPTPVAKPSPKIALVLGDGAALLWALADALVA